MIAITLILLCEHYYCNCCNNTVLPNLGLEDITNKSSWFDSFSVYVRSGSTAASKLSWTIDKSKSSVCQIFSF